MEIIERRAEGHPAGGRIVSLILREGGIAFIAAGVVRPDGRIDGYTIERADGLDVTDRECEQILETMGG
jgi:hypothetical protein